MSPNLASLAYLVSGVLFILALRGLSSPASARQGNRFGMIGMAIAIITSLLSIKLGGAFIGILVAMVVGGGIGAVIARRISMTAMPQLVAAFHSLVGMAAVLVAAAALYSPDVFHIAGPDGALHTQSLIELSLGVFIGAVTFSGSIIAFAKLNGNMSGQPILLPMRHFINLGLLAVAVILIIMLIGTHGVGGSAHTLFWMLTIVAFVFGVLLIIPIGGAECRWWFPCSIPIQAGQQLRWALRWKTMRF
jgi:NAD(P) transhydrogenase subunit beta